LLANCLDAIRNPRQSPMPFRLFRKSISMKLGVDLSTAHADVVLRNRRPEPKELWSNAW
jgi:hypothetical protein